ncbi:MAG: DUF2306 domain-containing protein [Pseudomonadota bacterium]
MNLAPLLAAPLAIQIHVVFAVISFVLGAVVLWRRKGGTLHRILGRVWVGAMLGVSFTGFFIHEIRSFGAFSPIHLFSVGVPIMMAMAIYFARTGQIEKHRRSMQGTYVGGMVIAGGFTFLPGRLNHEVLFGGNFPDIVSQSYAWIIPFVGVALGAIVLAVAERRRRMDKPVRR